MKLLISGYYGFGNLGDEALLAGTLPELKERGLVPTVLSARPKATARLHGVPAEHRVWQALPALLQTDALLSGGGGLLQDKTSGRSLSYYLGLIRLAKRLGKRVAVYGQSVGPLSEKGRQSVAHALSGVAVAVRDEASRQLLRSLSVPAHLSADAALLLSGAPAAPAGAVTLLIPRGGYPDITDGLIHLGRSLRGRGLEVAAVALQPGEDGSELSRLQAAVPDLILYKAQTPLELLSLIAGSAYVVSARLHGLILAANAGVDFCGVVYDPKVAAFCHEAGAPALTLPLNARALTRAALDRPEVPLERVAALKARAAAGLDWLEQQLKS